ncbi:MAG: CCC motif membrane protein [Bacteroidota bacterium]
MEENFTPNEQAGQPTIPPQQTGSFNLNAQPLPNATGVLVMGIISIALCWCYGIIGLALGIISLVLGGKATALYNENPKLYTESSYKNMKAGKICALIGTILSGLYLVYIIIIIIVYGFALTQMPWSYRF